MRRGEHARDGPFNQVVVIYLRAVSSAAEHCAYNAMRTNVRPGTLRGVPDQSTSPRFSTCALFFCQVRSPWESRIVEP
jgi:hypothetical protein